jgi:outer membrane autotransporter protein
MIDRLDKRTWARATRISALCGASAIAVLAAAPAGAQQAQPGGPQCPVVDQVVTCTGAIPNGFNGGNTPFNRLVVRDLTAPIRPPNSTSGIIVRNHDATIEVDASADIAVTNNSNLNSLTAGILMESGAYSLTSNATITATGRLATAGIGYQNQSSRPDIVRVVNNGSITVSGGDPSNSRSVRNGGIRIDFADRVSVLNAGSITASGPYAAGIAVGGLIPDIVDVEIVNTGSIRIDDTILKSPGEPGATGDYATAIDVTNPFLSNLTIRNSGTIEGGVIRYGRPRDLATRAPGNTTILVENSGILTRSGVLLYDRSVVSNDEPLDANTYDVTVSNSGTLTDSFINIVMNNVQGGRIRVRNDGAISALNESAILAEIVTGAGATGPSEAEVTNSASIAARSEPNQLGVAIEVLAGRLAAISNQGGIMLNGFSVIGLELRQGYFGQAESAACCSRSEGAFDGVARIVNSGAISGEGSNKIDGIIGVANADLLIENSGQIDLRATTAIRGTGTSPVFGEVFGGPDNYGIEARSFGNIAVNSAAPITVFGNISAGIGFTLFEHHEAEVPLLREGGFIDGTYDQARDFASQAVINVNADIRSLGYQSFGIFGELGLTEDDVDRDGPGSEGFFAFERGGSSARINVASGVTVAGGTGPGSGIALVGGGTVFLNNRGTITNLGDAGTGAVILGPSTFNARFDTLEFDDNDNPIDITIRPGLTINLVDSTNSGSMISTGGFGLRNANGRIVNFINTGLIQGGEGSVGATGTSDIANGAAGILDGRIALDGAGSRLTNAGVIRTSGAGFVTHQINGDFVQTATGTLILDAGTGGRDRMNVTGNVSLNGNFNVALGAPSAEAIFTAGGNLTLDGLLNVTDAGGFGSGVYRLFNYGGTLTDNGLELGALPGGATGNIQTVIANQVNLVVGSAVQFWDGGDTTADLTVDGGSGTWNNSNTNWTRAAGDVNEAWGGNFAVFQGTPGTVTVAPGGVSASGLQFAISGYTITGGPLTLNAPATLRVGDGSAAGAGYSATVASVISGIGGINKTDLGTLNLTGANTYAGNSRISGGVLQVAGDNNLGAAAAGVTLDGGTLRFSAAGTSARAFTIGAGGGTIDAANALTLSGAIGGAGALTKTGAGTLALSSNSSAFAGATSLNGGAINITGSLGGMLTVQNGARLFGTGSLGGLTVTSGGTLAPGGSIGTLNVSGNAIFRAGSIYELEIASAVGSGDRVAIGGTATIEGGTVRVNALDPETQYVTGTRYTFLTATGGRTGMFTGLTETSAFLDFALGYDATSAFLTVSVVRTFPNVALTFNQTQSSTALAAFGQTAGSDSLAVYNQLLLADTPTARSGFDAASGEIYSVLLASGLRQGAGRAERLLGRSHELGREGWGLWGSANGHDGRVDSDGNGARFGHNGIGGELGVDYRGAGNGWALGVGGGYSKVDVDLPARSSAAEADGWHLGAYARYGSGGEGFSAAVSGAYASGEADVARSVTVNTVTRAATANVELHSWSVGGQARYGMAAGGGWALGPQLQITHVSANLARFTETGASSLNLSGGGGNDDDRTRYGGGLFARWDGAKGSIDASVAYLSGGADPTEIGLSMAGATATPYRVRSTGGDGDTVQLSLAGRLELGGGWAIGGNVGGATGSNERYVQGNATIGWKF